MTGWVTHFIAEAAGSRGCRCNGSLGLNLPTMTRAVRRVVTAGLAAVALAAAPLAAPAVSQACPPGETGVIYGCAPFCVPGKVLDAQTGLCVPAPPPPQPPSR